MKNGDIRKQREGARELVERARAGDQNAKAMLSAIAQNAQRGNPKARSAIDCIRAYIAKNPIENPAVIGAEGQQVLSVLAEPSNPSDRILEVLCSVPFVGDELLIECCCVVLANGPNWSKPRVQAVESHIGHDMAKNLFRFGVASAADEKKLKPVAAKLPPDAIGILCAGHCIGTARKIQLVRLPQVPVGLLSPDIGWELGS